jgi:hypothetical protein
MLVVCSGKRTSSSRRTRPSRLRFSLIEFPAGMLLGARATPRTQHQVPVHRKLPKESPRALMARRRTRVGILQKRPLGSFINTPKSASSLYHSPVRPALALNMTYPTDTVQRAPPSPPVHADSTAAPFWDPAMHSSDQYFSSNNTYQSWTPSYTPPPQPDAKAIGKWSQLQCTYASD